MRPLDMSHRNDPQRKRVQVVLQLLPGTEPWVRVEHASGAFKLPLFCAIEELLLGAQQGWHDRPRHHLVADAVVRVPLALWREFEAQRSTREGSAPLGLEHRLR